jgi:microcystin-dependent protein
MEGYYAEIRQFAGNFAPKNWAFCQGQILSIAQNTALFSLLGTTYGGNGQTTFALPDTRGRVMVGTGQGPGLPNVDLGEVGGTPMHTMIIAELPAHNHTAQLVASTVKGTLQSPAAGVALGKAVDNAGTAVPFIYAPAGSAPAVVLDPASVTTGFAGNNQPFSITQPYEGMNNIICILGIFPSRN